MARSVDYALGLNLTSEVHNKSEIYTPSSQTLSDFFERWKISNLVKWLEEFVLQDLQNWNLPIDETPEQKDDRNKRLEITEKMTLFFKSLKDPSLLGEEDFTTLKPSEKGYLYLLERLVKLEEYSFKNLIDSVHKKGSLKKWCGITFPIPHPKEFEDLLGSKNAKNLLGKVRNLPEKDEFIFTLKTYPGFALVVNQDNFQNLQGEIIEIDNGYSFPAYDPEERVKKDNANEHSTNPSDISTQSMDRDPPEETKTKGQNEPTVLKKPGGRKKIRNINDDDGLNG
jgi:hypothetical protein